MPLGRARSNGAQARPEPYRRRSTCYIHAVEASADAKRAERYADKLAKLAPERRHLVHMPSHIYYRVGRYQDSLKTNQVAADRSTRTTSMKFAATGVYPLGYYSHNLHFVSSRRRCRARRDRGRSGGRSSRATFPTRSPRRCRSSCR